MADLGSAVHIDTSKQHPARMYDFYLDGKDHYEVDREAAEGVLAAFPGVKISAQTNRAFMHRATRILAQRGIRQFLDIGTGIPTAPNLHQVAQEIIPDARIVYADYDPIVLAHAQALLRSTPEGRTAYLHADVRDPESIIGAQELHETLNVNEPVALSLNALLHFIPDEDKPYEIVNRLVGALPSGSYLVVTHSTPDFAPEPWARITDIYRKGGIPLQVRSRAEVERFFDGLELMAPGVEMPHLWHPSAEEPALPGTNDETVSLYCGVGRKR